MFHRIASKAAILVSCCWGVATVPASASLLVTNPSFEAEQAQTKDYPPGWSGHKGYNGERTGNTNLLPDGEAAHGEFSFLMDSRPPSSGDPLGLGYYFIEQHIGQADDLLDVTLTVAVGKRQGITAADYVLSLWTGRDDTAADAELVATAASTAPTSWADDSITAYSVAQGTHLFVRLAVVQVDDGTPRQAFFDNVRVSSQVVPEPASLALLTAGSALCLFRRRR